MIILMILSHFFSEFYVSISDRALFLQYHVIKPFWYTEILDWTIYGQSGWGVYIAAGGVYLFSTFEI